MYETGGLKISWESFRSVVKTATFCKEPTSLRHRCACTYIHTVYNFTVVTFNLVSKHCHCFYSSLDIDKIVIVFNVLWTLTVLSCFSYTTVSRFIYLFFVAWTVSTLSCFYSHMNSVNILFLWLYEQCQHCGVVLWPGQYQHCLVSNMVWRISPFLLLWDNLIWLKSVPVKRGCVPLKIHTETFCHYC